jgi:uncharacterized protein (TIGR03435 family)
MRFTHVIGGLLALTLLHGLVSECGAQSGGWRFEVASIRPVDPSAALAALEAGKKPHLGTKIDAGRLDMGSMNLMGLICTAYSVRPDEVRGPAWLESQRFDIQATFPAGATEKDVPEMVRHLLEERFRLAAHRETKTEPVYALIVGPRGPKLDPPIPDEEFIKSTEGRADRGRLGAGVETMARLVTGGATDPRRISLENGVVHTEYAHISAEQLTQVFTTLLKRPVLDRTGLQGTYHLTLSIDQSDLLPGNTGSSATAGDELPAPSGSVFRAIDRLGLKLESRKGSVEHLAIDHIEKLPTAN